MNTERHRTSATTALGIACIALALASAPLAAQDEPDELEPDTGAEASVRRDAPEFEFEWSLEFQRDADRAAPDEEERDNNAAELELAIGLRQRFDERLSLLGDAELRARHRSGEGANDSDLTFGLERLYLQYDDADDTRRGRLGRQKIDDDMGWFIDENLDGASLRLDRDRTRIDASFTRESWLEVGTEDRDDIVYNALLALRVTAGGDTRWTPYILHRSERQFDNERAAETTWLGLQGIVRLDDAFRYWFNASARTGEEARVDRDRALGGTAVDLGVTWTLEQPFRPALTFGYASASGDADTEDGTDDTFRQSGLHSNEFALNDRNDFRYLGEVLDPELTNLDVITLGLGLQFDERWGVDLAWHNYRQVEKEDRLRGTDLDRDPTGESDDLGHALDLVIGYRRSDTLEFQAIAGRFDAGGAFAGPFDSAWLVRLEVEWEYGP